MKTLTKILLVNSFVCLLGVFCLTSEAMGQSWEDCLASKAHSVSCGAIRPPRPLPTGPSAQGDVMNPGEVLQPNQYISSPNSSYIFTYQGDGNLVLYHNGNPIWASNTNHSGAGICIMQGDGNLVLYAANGYPVWSSRTNNKPGSAAKVQDDGNAVIYAPWGQPIWATNTAGR